MKNKTIDYDNLLKIVNKNICINLHYFRKQKNYQELIERIIILANKCIEINDEQLTIIINCENYSIIETDLDFINHLIKFLQETYVDKLQYLYFINYSTFIKTIYNNIKKNIDKTTVHKIIFN